MSTGIKLAEELASSIVRLQYDPEFTARLVRQAYIAGRRDAIRDMKLVLDGKEK